MVKETRVPGEGYGCKRVRETIPYYTQTQIKVKEQLVASKKGYGCKRGRETIPHYTQTQIKVKEQLVASKKGYGCKRA